MTAAVDVPTWSQCPAWCCADCTGAAYGDHWWYSGVEVLTRRVDASDEGADIKVGLRRLLGDDVKVALDVTGPFGCVSLELLPDHAARLRDALGEALGRVTS